MLSQPPGLPVQNQPLQRDPVWVIFEILQIQYRVSGKLGLDKHPSFSNSVASPIVKAPGSNGQQSFPGAGDREPKSRSSPGDSEAVNSLSYMHSFSISFMCFLFCFSIWSIILNLEQKMYIRLLFSLYRKVNSSSQLESQDTSVFRGKHQQWKGHMTQFKFSIWLFMAV